MAFTLRTDDELDQALDDLAQRENLSRQEIIRRAVLDRHSRVVHQERVSESAQRQQDTWASVLERLGTV